MPTQKAKKPVKKTAAKAITAKNEKTSNGKNGRAAKAVPAPAPPPAAKPAPVPDAKSDAKLQYKAFEKGIQLLQKKHYKEAKELFEKARQGPSLEITSNAQSHVRMCERRLAAPPPDPKSSEDRYNLGVALINMRNLEQARRHLAVALEMEPRADHVYYAMAVCLALSGDAVGAYDSLKRAIDLQPRNRMAARQDSDLDAISNQPKFSRLLYPEKNP
jgi:tetratricopeptide (TPR) repeat protein